MELISINIPVLNASEFLAETISSILDQDYKNWKLIICDGGSDDGTIHILEYYAKRDQRISFLIKKGAGIAQARNFCFKESSGKYIAVMDGDDLMVRERLSYSLKFLKKEKADIVYSNYFEGDHHGNIMDIFNTGKIEMNKITLKDVCESQIVPHATMLTKRECFEKVEYRNRGKMDDDHYFIAKLYREGFIFKKMSYPVLIKRYHDNQAYRRDHDAYIAQSAELLELLT